MLWCGILARMRSQWDALEAPAGPPPPTHRSSTFASWFKVEGNPESASAQESGPSKGISRDTWACKGLRVEFRVLGPSTQ